MLGPLCARSSTLARLVACAALLGCTPGRGDPTDLGGAFEVIDPGTGEPNEAPLHPMVIGSRRAYAGGHITNVVLGPVDLWGTSAHRVATLRGISGTALIVRDVRLYASGAQGLALLGSAHDGPSDPPILWIPADLRDGMRWVVRDAAGGQATFRAERQRPRSIFGSAPVWRIFVESGGTELWTEYAEGFGPVAADDIPVDLAIVPAEVAPTPTGPRLELGPPIFEESGIVPQLLGLVHMPDGARVARVGGYVEISGGSMPRTTVDCLRFAPDGAFVGQERTRFDDPGDDGRSAECPNAMAAAFDAAGELTQPAAPAVTVAQTGVLTSFRGRGGTIARIGRSTSVWVGNESLLLGPLDRPFDTVRERGPFERFFLVDAVQDEATIGFAEWIDGRLFHGRVHGIDPARRRIDGDGALRLLASFHGARVAATLDADGRTYLISSAEGAIDRVAIDADGVTVERVGVVALPDGDELVGAMELDASRLLVVTMQRAATGLAATNLLWSIAALPGAPVESEATLAAHNVLAWPTGRDVRVCWRGRAADGIGTWTLGGAPAEAYLAFDGGDMVCAIVLRDLDDEPDGDAAWLVRGTVPGIGDLAIGIAPSSFDPSAAPVLDPATSTFASIAGGAFVTPTYLHSEDALPIGAPRGYVDFPPDVVTPMADVAGGGVWRARPIVAPETCPEEVAEPCHEVVRIGTAPLRLHVPGGFDRGLSPSRFVSPVAGGGVIWRAGEVDGMGRVVATYAIIDGEGGYTELAPIADTLETSHQAADDTGRVCGIRLRRGATAGSTIRDLFCRAPDGSIVYADVADAGPFMGPWFPGRGGFYVQIAGGWAFVDPATAIPTEVDLSAFPPVASSRLALPSHSPSGELFVRAVDADGAVQAIYELADGAAIAQEVPELARAPRDPAPFLVGDDLFVIASAPPLRWARDPR